MRWHIAVGFMAVWAVSAYGTCDFDTLKKQGVLLLQPVQPKVEGSACYRQALRFRGGSEYKLKQQTDFARREIPMVFMDRGQCAATVIIESRTIVGRKLSKPLGGYITLAPRPFGPIWNDFNTQSTTGRPGVVVGLVKWRRYSSPKEEYWFYVPYSPDLVREFPELAEVGKRHLSYDMQEALAGLEARNLVDDDFGRILIELWPRIFRSESIDPYEFKVADDALRLRIADQPFVTLGANGNVAYLLKVSSAGAKGMMQSWGPSCEHIHDLYPAAGLAKDCNGAEWASHEHVGSLAAAGLELKDDDLTLARLLDPAVRRRPDYKRMLEASYNGGPGWVVKAYRAYGEDWAKPHYVRRKRNGKLVRTNRLTKNSLRAETFDYLFKCDYLERLEKRTAEQLVTAGTR
jgi:hypothetical protein